MKDIIFHGGPITETGFENTGCTFWSTNFHQAKDYADNGEIYVIEIDWSKELILRDEDFLNGRSYADSADNEDNMAMQVSAILRAIANGATVVDGDDGSAILNVQRLTPRRVTLNEARAIWEDLQ